MQIKRLAGLLVIVCVLALSGCARLEFYNKPNFEGTETGVKFYYCQALPPCGSRRHCRGRQEWGRYEHGQ